MDNFAFFQKERDNLIAKYTGRYALIVNGELVKTFEQYKNAIAAMEELPAQEALIVRLEDLPRSEINKNRLVLDWYYRRS